MGFEATIKFLNTLGIDGVQQGDEYVAPCPGHRDRTGKPDSNPSWSFNLEKNIHHCFSCGFKGSLKSLLGESDRVQPSVDVSSLEEELQDIESVRFSYPPLIDLPESSLSVFVEPPEWALSQRMISAESCEAFGVLWDHRTDSWIIPIRSGSGGLRGWQIKSQTSRRFRNFPRRVKKSSYLFGDMSGEYTIVVESPLDSVRLYDLGYFSSSIYGSRPSIEQILQLRSGFHQVVCALDGDAAGVSGTEIMSKELPGVWTVSYPKGVKDVGEMDEDAVHRLIQSRTYFLEEMCSRGN